MGFMSDILGATISGTGKTLSRNSSNLVTTVANNTAVGLGVGLAVAAGAYLVKNIIDDEDIVQRTRAEKREIFRRNLKNLREIANWDINDAAEIAEVTKQAIINTENGKTKLNVGNYTFWVGMFKDIAEGTKDEILMQVLKFLTLDLDHYNDEKLAEYEKVIDQIAKARKSHLDDALIELLASKMPN